MMIDFVSNSFSGNTAYGLLRWEGRGEGERGKVQTLKDNMADY